MNRHLIIPAFIGMAMIAGLCLFSGGLPVVIVFIPFIPLAYILYLRTYYKYPQKTDKVLPLYLAALSVQCLHFYEEYHFGFTVRLPAILGWEPFPLEKWVLFNMVAYSLFILGGIALYRQLKSLAIIPLFYILTGTVGNGLAHVAVSLTTGGYFPGLYTAMPLLVLGLIMLKNLLQESNTQEDQVLKF